MKAGSAEIAILCAVAASVAAGCVAHASGDKAHAQRAEFCAVANPILIGEEDRFSLVTAKEILAHNETGRKLCGWKPR